jgi:type IV pilus assembly protein PilV
MRPLSVLRSKRGFSLVEVMIALVVVLLVSLAMMQTALVGIDSNMLNAVRNEAIRVADERLAEARNLAIGTDDFNAMGSDVLAVTRNVRNVVVTYNTTRTVTPFPPPPAAASTKQVVVTVTWRWKNLPPSLPYTYSESTLLKSP